MIDFQKLRHEWKTFTLSIVGIIVGVHDAVIAAGFAPDDFAPVIPEHYKPYAPLVFGLGMLALRKWKDVVDTK